MPSVAASEVPNAPEIRKPPPRYLERLKRGGADCRIASGVSVPQLTSHGSLSLSRQPRRTGPGCAQRRGPAARPTRPSLEACHTTCRQQGGRGNGGQARAAELRPELRPELSQGGRWQPQAAVATVVGSGPSGGEGRGRHRCEGAALTFRLLPYTYWHSPLLAYCLTFCQLTACNLILTAN